MKFFKDICTLIGVAWIGKKTLGACYKLGEMKATYKFSKKLYNGLTGDQKESV